jgi:hypothetical protein
VIRIRPVIVMELWFDSSKSGTPIVTGLTRQKDSRTDQKHQSNA